MKAVLLRELRLLTYSPLVWALSVLILAVHGALFAHLVSSYTPGGRGITYEIANLALGSSAYVALLVLPLLTMSMISGERRRQVLLVLRQAPLSSLAIVSGKYLALLIYNTLLMVVMACLPLIMLNQMTTAVSLDTGLYASAWLGTWLLFASFLAIGLLASSLSRQAALAALLGVSLCLVLWLAPLLQLNDVPHLQYWIGQVTVLQHYGPFMFGQVHSVHVMYFVVLIGVCLLWSSLRLEQLRYVND